MAKAAPTKLVLGKDGVYRPRRTLRSFLTLRTFSYAALAVASVVAFQAARHSFEKTDLPERYTPTFGEDTGGQTPGMRGAMDSLFGRVQLERVLSSSQIPSRGARVRQGMQYAGQGNLVIDGSGN